MQKYLRMGGTMDNIDSLPDIQHTMFPEVKLPINQVGVENVKTKFVLRGKDGSVNHILANVSMSTDLSSEIKGISMSKLLRTLIKYLDTPLNHDVIDEILREFRIEVETNSSNSFMRFDFEYPILKQAPISKLEFPQFYKCAFEGRLVGKKFNFYQKVVVPYQSYCCCSASLCEHLELNGKKGFPHAQRAFATVLVEVVLSEILWLEDIIDIVEKAVVNVTYPLLRRKDEQEVARIAAENPMFVEDAIRFISKGLNDDPRIFDWIAKCSHEESLHTSEAIAINWKGIKGGFDGLLFL